MRKRRHYELSGFGNMDKTPVWLEMPGKSTLNEAGKKAVSVTSTGHDIKRYTVILAALADGTKLTPLVLLPGVCPPPSTDIPTGIAIYMCGTGKSWANEDVIPHWLAKIWGRQNSRRRLLVWDSFRGHIVDPIKKRSERFTTVTLQSYLGVVLQISSKQMCHGMAHLRKHSAVTIMNGCFQGLST